MGSRLLPLFGVPTGRGGYDMGLVNGQLNGPCLIDSEIVTGSIDVGGGELYFLPSSIVLG